MKAPEGREDWYIPNIIWHHISKDFSALMIKPARFEEHDFIEYIRKQKVVEVIEDILYDIDFDIELSDAEKIIRSLDKLGESDESKSSLFGKGYVGYDEQDI